MKRVIHALAVLIGFALATLVMTWPVGVRLADHLVVPQVFIGQGPLPTSPDTYLHLWILTWVHRALTTAPAMLFDAPIMYPAARALAGSEHMLGHWPIHGPVYAASGNPVLAYQWVLVSSFILNGAALYALAYRWTGSAPAALVGGFIYAFVPLRFDLIGTVQHANVAYLPLLVLFADRYRAAGRPSDLVVFGALCGIQLLCSYYLAYATAVAVGVVVLAAASCGNGGGTGPRALALALVAALATVPLVAVSLPYLALRSADVVPVYPEAWLRAASATPLWFVQPATPLFAGYVALLLAAIGAVRWGALRPDQSRWGFGVVAGTALAGFILVLGPTGIVFGADVPLPYRALYEWVPGFASLRYPYRFGTLTVLAMALLAAVGSAWLLRQRRAPSAWALAAIVVVVLGIEYRQAPLELVRVEVGDEVPPAYRWLAAHGDDRPVLDWPIARPGDVRAGFEQSRAMYFSTYHRLPIVNGYTAYEPPSHALLFHLAQRLPDERSVRDLVDLSGVRLVLLHGDRLRAREKEEWKRFTESGGCRPLAEFGADLICELPPQHTDLRPRLLAANSDPPTHTFRGLALEPIAGDGRAEIVPPERKVARAGMVGRFELTASNTGRGAWPGLAPLVPGVVTLRHRWRSQGAAGGGSRNEHGPDGGASDTWEEMPILCDVAPGASCRIVLPAVIPRQPGPYLLELAIGQHAGPDFLVDDRPTLAVPVRVVAGRRPGSRR